MTIRMPDEYRARIEEIASRKGLKKSHSARLGIRKFLDDFEAGESRKKPEVEAKDLIGVVSSGVSDLETNHRDHLLKLMRGRKSWKPSWTQDHGLPLRSIRTGWIWSCGSVV